jgi:hypothetical protein
MFTFAKLCQKAGPWMFPFDKLFQKAGPW